MSSLTLTSKADLITYFEHGIKSSRSIGLEHEQFVFNQTLKRLPYKGKKPTIQSLLEAFIPLGWTPIYENALLIALKKEGSLISLEPGGQLEFSSSPHLTVFDLQKEHLQFLDDLQKILQKHSSFALGLGFDPLSTRKEVPWMPKDRYIIMREKMSKSGTLGLDMMLRTATFQVNLDYSSEKDMCDKLRVGLALHPLIVGLFASSPLKERQPTGFQSYRSYVWHHTDPKRTGQLDFAFEKTMGFERYVDYLLDIPLYFIYRQGTYIPLIGETFRDFLEKGLSILPKERPTEEDWSLHISTIFPDVRLKNYLEIRGADASPNPFIGEALAAFWTGLLYDDQSFQAIKDFVNSLSPQERSFLWTIAPREGLNTHFRGKRLWDFAEECLNLAQAGLKRRHIMHQNQLDESLFLKPLFEYIDQKKSFSDILLEAWVSKTPSEQDLYLKSLSFF